MEQKKVEQEIKANWCLQEKDRLRKWNDTESKMKKYIFSVVNSDINLLILISRPGLSKTFTTETTLDTLGTKYIKITGHCTPLELYKLLYENRNGVIFIDDTQVLLESPSSRSLIMAAVWAATSNNRTITYASSTSKLDGIDNRFEFTGKVIICANSIPRKCEAMCSRGLFYEFNHNRNTVITKMKDISSNKNIPAEIVQHIENITTLANLEISLRDLHIAYELYKKHKDWKSLVANQLKAKDEDIILLRSMECCAKTSDQLAMFIRKSGMSRTTFFRKKRMLEEE